MAQARMYVMVPIDADTVVAGAREIKNRLSAELGRRGLQSEVDVVETGSFGPSNAGVVLVCQPDGIVYGHITAEKLPRLIEEHIVKGRPCDEWILPGEHALPAAGQAGDPRAWQHAGRVVLDNCGRINPESITEYIARDGYMGLARAVTELTPADVIAQVKASGLRGRGGAGFATGLKWDFCARHKASEKYVICNADEGEPGTFKDRLIMEGDPHKVIEGMAICAYAIGATRGFVYIRGEYSLSVERLKRAIEAARQYGFLGKRIFERDFEFDVELRMGAGAYVCGEETALIESMEGKRGLPRLKPPFPAESGFRGKPTNVNNVETLANVPAILRNGPDWFKRIGAPGTPGTKVYTILGHVNRPGLIEVPTGVTLREIIEDYGGGMKGGPFHMAQLGGTAGDILGAAMLDVPLDYDSLQKVGHMLGSGAILVMNPSVDIKDFLHVCLRFFTHESCGNCNPCRNGLHMLGQITERLRKGEAYAGDIEALEEVSTILKQSAFCPLGQSPAAPIMSALRYFREEIETGVNPALRRPRAAHTGRKLATLSE